MDEYRNRIGGKMRADWRYSSSSAACKDNLGADRSGAPGFIDS